MSSTRPICDTCSSTDIEPADDGFFYCTSCGTQCLHLQQTDIAVEDLLDGGIYSASQHRRTSQPSKPKPDFHPPASSPNSEPRDFPNEVLVGEGNMMAGIRGRYVGGLQLMMRLQCEALVESFGVSAVVCGIVGSVWLRFLKSSGVFDEEWGTGPRFVEESDIEGDAELLSQERKEGGKKSKKHIRASQRSEPRNEHGKRSIYIWLRELRKTVPLYSSLAISFLACHIAREAVLPTDIYDWASQGKIPYLTAFLDIDKHLGSPSSSCPLTSRSMFRPKRVIGAWSLEVAAGAIAQTIGLHLPSVNFYAIASRYLKDLSLPPEEILPHACRLYEWSIPAELWLSSNVFRHPSRVCVMAILIVALRIMYNIHGQGIWERSSFDFDNSGFTKTNSSAESLSSNSERKICEMKESERCEDIKHSAGTKLNARKLLHILESSYDKMCMRQDYFEDLSSFVKYCDDEIFAGMTPSYLEETLIGRCRDMLSKADDNVQSGVKDEFVDLKSGNHGVRLNTTPDYLSPESRSNQQKKRKMSDEKISSCSIPIKASADTAMEMLKLSMVESGFHYLAPRIRVKTDNYLHYVRKKVDGELIYAAHADYYILLRACARLAQVDIRTMHLGVLKFERRLAWIERRVDSSLYTLHEGSYLGQEKP